MTRSFSPHVASLLSLSAQAAPRAAQPTLSGMTLYQTT